MTISALGATPPTSADAGGVSVSPAVWARLERAAALLSASMLLEGALTSARAGDPSRARLMAATALRYLRQCEPRP